MTSLDDQTSHVSVEGSHAKIASARERLPDTFALLDRMCDGVHDHMVAPGTLKMPETALDTVLLHGWHRTYNIIKGIRLPSAVSAVGAGPTARAMGPGRTICATAS